MGPSDPNHNVTDHRNNASLQGPHRAGMSRCAAFLRLARLHFAEHPFSSPYAPIFTFTPGVIGDRTDSAILRRVLVFMLRRASLMRGPRANRNLMAGISGGSVGQGMICSGACTGRMRRSTFYFWTVRLSCCILRILWIPDGDCTGVTAMGRKRNASSEGTE